MDPLGIGAANTFKENVVSAKANGVVDHGEFEGLHADYKRLPTLTKYSIRSWLAGEHPELADTVTDRSLANGWANLQAVTGR